MTDRIADLATQYEQATTTQTTSTTQWTKHEYRLATRRIRQVLRDKQVPLGLRDEIADEALAQTWAYLAKHGDQLRATLVAWGHARGSTLESPELTTVRSAARRCALRAINGSKLVRTKPHGKYRDAMSGKPTPKRIGLEQPVEHWRPVLEYLTEQVNHPQAPEVAQTHPGDVLDGIVDRLPKIHQPLARKLSSGLSQRDIAQSRNVSRRQVWDEVNALRPALAKALSQARAEHEID